MLFHRTLALLSIVASGVVAADDTFTWGNSITAPVQNSDGHAIFAGKPRLRRSLTAKGEDKRNLLNAKWDSAATEQQRKASTNFSSQSDSDPMSNEDQSVNELSIPARRKTNSDATGDQEVDYIDVFADEFTLRQTNPLTVAFEEKRASDFIMERAGKAGKFSKTKTKSGKARKPEPETIIAPDDNGVEAEDNDIVVANMNQPIIHDIQAETTVNVATLVPVFDNDDNVPPGGSGYFTQALNGTVSFQGMDILYLPDKDFCGTDQFDYTVLDSTGLLSDTATVTVNVACLPNEIEEIPEEKPSANVEDQQVDVASVEQPILNDDTAETPSNTDISIPVLNNDAYVPTNATGSMTLPLHGTVSFQGQNLHYIPDNGFCGTDQFTYTVSESTGQFSDTATVTVNVLCPQNQTEEVPVQVAVEEPEDDQAGEEPKPNVTDQVEEVPPQVSDEEPDEEVTAGLVSTDATLVANDDFETTSQGAGLVLSILDNDIMPGDANGGFDAPSNGILSNGPTGLVYTPNDGFCGVDTFIYTLSNRELSDSATVTIDVVCDIPEPLTPAPSTAGTSENPTRMPTTIVKDTSVSIVVNDDFAEGNMNEELDIPILENDIFPADVGGEFSTPKHGVLVRSTSNGLIYRPDSDFCGIDSFIYWLTSGDLSEFGEVTVNILCDASDKSSTPVVDGGEEEEGMVRTEQGTLPVGAQSQVQNEEEGTDSQSEESENQFHSETMSFAIAGAGVVLLLALTSYANKRRDSPRGEKLDSSGPWFKSFITNRTEVSSLTSEQPSETESVSSQDIEVGGSTNLSVTAFLSGEVRSSGVIETSPLSPTKSLFSVSSSSSGKDYTIGDVVDL